MENLDPSSRVDQVLQVNPLILFLSRQLLDLVDPKKGERLTRRLKDIRNFIFMRTGIVVPGMRISDDLNLPPFSYAINLKGITKARGEAPSDTLLLGPERILRKFDGIASQDPVTGLPARWTNRSARAEARRLGLQVLEPVSAIARHLKDVIQDNIYRFLDPDFVEFQIMKVAHHYDEKLADEVLGALSLSGVRRILIYLARERISIIDMDHILTTVKRHMTETQDVGAIAERVRQSLVIERMRDLAGERGVIQIMKLDRSSEELLLTCRHETPSEDILILDHRRLRDLISEVERGLRKAARLNVRPRLICRPSLRTALSKLLRESFGKLEVLSDEDVVPALKRENIHTIRLAGRYFNPLHLAVRRLESLLEMRDATPGICGSPSQVEKTAAVILSLPEELIDETLQKLGLTGCGSNEADRYYIKTYLKGGWRAALSNALKVPSVLTIEDRATCIGDFLRSQSFANIRSEACFDALSCFARSDREQFLAALESYAIRDCQDSQEELKKEKALKMHFPDYVTNTVSLSQDITAVSKKKDEINEQEYNELKAAVFCTRYRNEEWLLERVFRLLPYEVLLGIGRGFNRLRAGDNFHSVNDTVSSEFHGDWTEPTDAAEYINQTFRRDIEKYEIPKIRKLSILLLSLPPEAYVGVYRHISKKVPYHTFKELLEAMCGNVMTKDDKARERMIEEFFTFCEKKEYDHMLLTDAERFCRRL